MVQIINRQPTSIERFAENIAPAVQGIGMMLGQNLKRQREQRASDEEALKLQELTGQNLRGLSPELRKEFAKYSLEAGAKAKKTADQLKTNQKIVRGLERQRDLEEGSLSAFEDDPKMAEVVSRPAKEKPLALTEKPVPEKIANKIESIINENPKATADQLRVKMDNAKIPPVYSNPYIENRRRTEETSGKIEEGRRESLRKETLPIRQEYANKANAARKGIQNKEHLIDLVKTGNLDDPTIAALAEALPLKLGKRLLSNETVEYKSGLIDEFTDLRNIFQGQTRLKEIELLEDKVADLYLTDDQKIGILKSRINALKADIIRADAAAELEDRLDLGILQFDQEVEKLAKPKLEKLFHDIIDEQKSIINAAERKKELPLDLNDPDDVKIIDAILQEANGNAKEAERIAKKKGYKF
jgi:hypothetical protein